jgi:predicted ArsR family transcriptional regulator
MPGERVPEVPRAQWQPLRPDIAELCSQPGGILVAYRTYGYRLQEIAGHLGVHPSTISRALDRLELADRAARATGEPRFE